MQITDAAGEVWEAEDLKLYYDAEGYIQYGYQPNGFFVISGQNGPEAKGWPGVTLKPGLHVLRSKAGHIRPVSDEEFTALSSTQKGAMPPAAPKSAGKTEQTPLGAVKYGEEEVGGHKR